MLLNLASPRLHSRLGSMFHDPIGLQNGFSNSGNISFMSNRPTLEPDLTAAAAIIKRFLELKIPVLKDRMAAMGVNGGDPEAKKGAFRNLNKELRGLEEVQRSGDDVTTMFDAMEDNEIPL